MSDNKRQYEFDELKRTDYKIENQLDFDDCADYFDVIEAACKLLVDNFDIAHDGTYIKEIIEQACFESAKRGCDE